jgi:hypothetical protein
LALTEQCTVQADRFLVVMCQGSEMGAVSST